MFSLNSKAQNNHFELGILPSINLMKKLVNNWDAQFNTEFRQGFVQNFLSEKSTFRYEYIHTDFTFILNKSNEKNIFSYGLGYVLRSEASTSEMHRFLIQIKNRSNLNNTEISYRIRIDASFQNNYSPIYRVRSKFKVSLPINNSCLSFNLGNEFVNIFSGTSYDLEIRTLPSLTVKLNQNKKLNFGLDYRTRSFLDNPNFEGNYWITMKYFISL